MNRRILSALLILALAACSQGAGFPPPVPPLQPETLPLPPIAPTEQVWRPGSWNWDGAGYRWQAGEYIPRSPEMVLWRYGFWQQTSGGWTWQPPGWVQAP